MELHLADKYVRGFTHVRNYRRSTANKYGSRDEYTLWEIL